MINAPGVENLFNPFRIFKFIHLPRVALRFASLNPRLCCREPFGVNIIVLSVCNSQFFNGEFTRSFYHAGTYCCLHLISPKFSDTQ